MRGPKRPFHPKVQLFCAFDILLEESSPLPLLMQSNNNAIQVLRIPAYRNFMVTRTALTLAVNMLGTVVMWQVYERTQDNFAVGLLGLAEFIPFFCLTLLGGYLADRIDRKKILVYSILGYSACVVALLLLSTQLTWVLDGYGTLPIYAVIVGTGVVRGFLGPAQSAFTAQLVPKDMFAQASTISTMSWNLGAVGGPALAGLVYAEFGVATVYAIITILVVVSFLSLLAVPSQPMPTHLKPHPNEHTSSEELLDDLKQDTRKDEGILENLAVGIRFVKNTPVVWGALALDMFAVLFGGAVAMLPGFAAEVLHTGPEGLGMLRAAPAIGALGMSSCMALLPPMTHAGRNLMVCIAGFGLATIGFALSTNFHLSLFMLALTGAFDNVSMVVRGTLIQLYTPDDMRGRVSAVNGLFIGSSNELGAFESGVAARALGLVRSVVFGGCMTLVVVGSMAWLNPTLRRLRLGERE